MKIPITVNRSINGADLFLAFLQSQYMKNRGYGILYNNNYGHGDYGLCYKHDKDLIFIHIRVLAVYPPNTFSYLISLGEKQYKSQIGLDLKSLVKEIETNP
ncbi:MAG: hypothetical protein HYT63_00620 [Candidatus Yanofskybacteria bacterium]|nr:hypothetical protein [Candidatus Yanofskybacteria bacterium]